MNSRNPAPSGTASWLRRVNDAAAFRLLIEYGPLSRSQLGELSGMSKPTAGQMIHRLESLRLIGPMGESSGSRGPSAVTYGVLADSLAGVAISIQEGSIESVLVDPTDGEHPVAVIPAVGLRSPAADVTAAVAAACEAAGVDPARVSRVVVGVQAAVHHNGDRLAYTDTLPGWPLLGARTELERATSLAVTIDNDANLATIAESALAQSAASAQGAVADADADADGGDGGAAGSGLGDGGAAGSDFVYVWLGHGIGTGFEVDGRILRGSTGAAGEIGYIDVPISAASVAPHARDFTDLLGHHAVVDLVGGADYDSALAALPGHPTAVAAYAARVAILVRTLVAMLDPARVVLGGPSGSAGGTRLAEAVADHLPSGPRIEAGRAGRLAVLSGARRLLVEQIRTELEERIKENE